MHEFIQLASIRRRMRQICLRVLLPLRAVSGLSINLIGAAHRLGNITDWIFEYKSL